jgi:hypothetical protein
MIIYVDIDETICTNNTDKASRELDYSNAQPIISNIEKINKMFDEGNKIVYWTARGTLTKKDWSHVTIAQFEKWGVKYHELKFEKPVYDLFICDKSLNPSVWNGNTNTR